MNKREILPAQEIQPWQLFLIVRNICLNSLLDLHSRLYRSLKRGAAKDNGGPGTNMRHGDHLLLIPFIV